MSEQNPVQGMYCIINDVGTRKCTVTMADVSLTMYREVNLLTFDMGSVKRHFNRIVQAAKTNINREQYEQDFLDFINVLNKVKHTEMKLRSGDKVLTYAIGQPVVNEIDGFVELSPSRAEWWTHPGVEPIVKSITSYLPDFKPWLLQKDDYIGILSARSSLL